MIELGLARITRLLNGTAIPWRAIHVAGTNGKGSVCAYASAILNANNIRCGRFTSPHLIDRWDCISIGEKAVNRTLFLEVESQVKARDERENIKASEFEILTATAFQIFSREKIDVAVVEVGVGGRHDATNLLRDVSVTVITKIGKDHQALLGDTIEEIAYQKAGIMKPNVPCFVDGSNPTNVIEVLRKNAEDVQAGSLVLIPQSDLHSHLWTLLPTSRYEDHQKMHIHIAFEAARHVAADMDSTFDFDRSVAAIQQTIWPGRLQTLSIEAVTGRSRGILLDGAHNLQSAKVLAAFVDRKFRLKDAPVTWVIAVSRGKDVRELLTTLLRPGDNIFAVDFTPVDGMPWVLPTEADTIAKCARGLGFINPVGSPLQGLKETLQLASDVSEGGPLVIAGSLYLVSDVLRLLRAAPHKLEGG